jgi:hypothetical protein
MKKLIILLLVMVMAVSISGNALAAENNKSSKNIHGTNVNIADFKQKASELRISAKVQEKLIEKLQSGEILDADNPEKYTKKVKDALKLTDKEPRKEYTFPDGSKVVVSVTPVNQPEKVAGITAIDGPDRTKSCGSGYCRYYSHRIAKETVTIAMSFLADFTIINGAYDYIRLVWDESAAGFGGTVTVPSLSILRATETSNYRANARLETTFTYFNDGASTDQTLNLWVGSNYYTVY